MPYQFTLYDAFSGMNPVEKNKVVRFLCDHTHNSNRQSVQEAVEYAIKLKPSFGGFILAVEKERQLIGVIVANRTGMESYNPKNIFVFVTLHRDYQQDKSLIQTLIQRAIRYADGDIAMHVEPNNPALDLYQELGFKAQYLELRLSNQQSSAVA
ncbi:MAG: GNAT family N-acetyltransferase [Phaeodactylibacter sp.]|nr:GNAT family N-acetyltransferase [Phaeodactylibacter sp.]MCB9265209.1 GNAT family N-acetyltransferase [Lewinellaceae bacterium]MCB9285929.1 GNAT family N-acetyltransferase [Lewinellaceae bacterium]